MHRTHSQITQSTSLTHSLIHFPQEKAAPADPAPAAFSVSVAGRVPARGRENPYPFATLTHRGFRGWFTEPGAVEENEKFLVKLFTKSLQGVGQSPTTLRS